MERKVVLPPQGPRLVLPGSLCSHLPSLLSAPLPGTKGVGSSSKEHCLVHGLNSHDFFSPSIKTSPFSIAWLRPCFL